MACSAAPEHTISSIATTKTREVSSLAAAVPHPQAESEVGLNADWLRREDVEWLRAQGILTFSNLGDYPEGWRNIVACGAAGFKTNYVEAYTDWWQARHAD